MDSVNNLPTAKNLRQRLQEFDGTFPAFMARLDADGTPYRISSGIQDGSYGLFIADPQLQTILHPELLAVLELEPEAVDS